MVVDRGRGSFVVVVDHGVVDHGVVNHGVVDHGGRGSLSRWSWIMDHLSWSWIMVVVDHGGSFVVDYGGRGSLSR
jgi:hypothetical protein